MVDAGSIAAAIGSLKSAADIARGFLDLKEVAAVQGKVIELQTKILEAQASALFAQEERAAIIAQVRSLEQDVARLKEWDAGKDRYRFAQIFEGVFAYVPNIEAGNQEEPHWLCVSCYDKRQRSVLQYQGRTSDKHEAIFGCPACKTTVRTHWSFNPQVWAQEQKRRKPARAPGEACPKCGAPEYRVDRADRHPDFGEMGARIHHMKCGECGFEDEKLVTP